MEHMKLSIITINYNNAAGLKKTLDSVAMQTCTDFEHIIIDGASTDNSINIIQEYQQSLASNLSPLTSRLKWLSEPDTGIYNAMNKGVRMAIGEYTLMLNSGDYLVDENVIGKIMSQLDGTDIIQGNRLELVNRVIYCNSGYGKSNISYFDVMKGHFLHQASFCRRDLFDRFGFFDENFRIIGDTKFFMVCLGIGNASFRYVDINICNYDMNGVSAEIVNGKWNIERGKEETQLRRELYPERLLNFFYNNEKKIRLYDKLHKHKWIWYMVMLITHLHDWLYIQDEDVKRRKLGTI